MLVPSGARIQHTAVLHQWGHSREPTTTTNGEKHTRSHDLHRPLPSLPPLHLRRRIPPSLPPSRGRVRGRVHAIKRSAHLATQGSQVEVPNGVLISQPQANQRPRAWRLVEVG